MTSSVTISGVHAQSGPDDRLALIRRYYQAYENDDRPAIERLLNPDFTFTSPDDDRVDRAMYFERCWPGYPDIVSFTLLDVCADAQGALVRYEAAVSAGPGFACVEHFEFSGDRTSHIDAYFGRELGPPGP